MAVELNHTIVPEVYASMNGRAASIARRRAPPQRLGTPQDVATAAAFLASDGSALITGVVLDVAGGAVLV
jgi:NAD(P)-dependent dehydrogenase (short-subunit alcohol dehydrogenase family)